MAGHIEFWALRAGAQHGGSSKIQPGASSSCCPKDRPLEIRLRRWLKSFCCTYSRVRITGRGETMMATPRGSNMRVALEQSSYLVVPLTEGPLSASGC